MKKVTVTVQGWPHKTESIAQSINKVFERHACQGRLGIMFIPDEEELKPKSHFDGIMPSSFCAGVKPSQESVDKMMKAMYDDEEVNDLVSSLFEGLTMITEIEKSKNYPKNDSERGDVPRKESDGSRVIGDILDDIFSGNPSYGWKVKNGVMVPDQESFFDKEMAKQKDQFEKDSDFIDMVIKELSGIDLGNKPGQSKETTSKRETLTSTLIEKAKKMLEEESVNFKTIRTICQSIQILNGK